MNAVPVKGSALPVPLANRFRRSNFAISQVDEIQESLDHVLMKIFEAILDVVPSESTQAQSFFPDKEDRTDANRPRSLSNVYFLRGPCLAFIVFETHLQHIV